MTLLRILLAAAGLSVIIGCSGGSGSPVLPAITTCQNHCPVSTTGAQ